MVLIYITIKIMLTFFAYNLRMKRELCKKWGRSRGIALEGFLIKIQKKTNLPFADFIEQ